MILAPISKSSFFRPLFSNTFWVPRTDLVSYFPKLCLSMFWIWLPYLAIGLHPYMAHPSSDLLFMLVVHVFLIAHSLLLCRYCVKLFVVFFTKIVSGEPATTHTVFFEKPSLYPVHLSKQLLRIIEFQIVKGVLGQAHSFFRPGHGGKIKSFESTKN